MLECHTDAELFDLQRTYVRDVDEMLPWEHLRWIISDSDDSSRSWLSSQVWYWLKFNPLAVMVYVLLVILIVSLCLFAASCFQNSRFIPCGFAVWMAVKLEMNKLKWEKTVVEEANESHEQSHKNETKAARELKFCIGSSTVGGDIKGGEGNPMLVNKASTGFSFGGEVELREVDEGGIERGLAKKKSDQAIKKKPSMIKTMSAISGPSVKAMTRKINKLA
ncbi:hypothetical protein TrST_g111 [Triparma strigata]|uniref:Uncharacterized protein n=1 Tax=Triparma strigata TaxID=1606541 RepID=A0A9W7A7X8_9STRA|nr:hypothetical protein TrST_g111 [Triparma strigata]